MASGSEYTAQGLRNDDALALQRNSRVALSYQQVNPLTFAEPTSPHIISADEGTPLPPPRSPPGCASWSRWPTGCWWKGLGAGLRRCPKP
ncbi:ATP-dependent dethiobiotin synthetase BioD 1 [Raoultella terrigena]|uniref:ATP-dependent dethiobiotin synthetase BioD 1 n=1 Tax=Raoultella terrigena TaxID=577 RepID=A0A3P8M4R0_RAOTE|nr:ATP-dependent dethiobiotin synthetase BioD 1 [Raoultella terrigena]